MVLVIVWAEVIPLSGVHCIISLSKIDPFKRCLIIFIQANSALFEVLFADLIVMDIRPKHRSFQK